MKTKCILNLCLAWTLCILISGAQELNAQNAVDGAAPNETIDLTGSNIKTEDIILKSDTVFIGEITKYGIPDISHLGIGGYFGMQVGVSKVLQGSSNTNPTVRLSFTREANHKERPPKIGSFYIFFAKRNGEKDPDLFTILKLLPATDANITKVKALIAAAPAPK